MLLGLDCNSTESHFYTAGFPLDKAPSTMWREDCGVSGTSCEYDPGILRHTCDVVPGMSGAPLWDENWHIKAIHRGEEWLPGSSSNIAVFITPFVYNTIRQWISGPDNFVWEVLDTSKFLHFGQGKIQTQYTTDNSTR